MIKIKGEGTARVRTTILIALLLVMCNFASGVVKANFFKQLR